VYDLDELLCWLNGAQCGHAGRLLLDALEELSRELEVDVRFEKDSANLAESLLDVGVGEDTTPAEASEGRLEFLLQLVKHSP
jgi:hypothetical protein